MTPRTLLVAALLVASVGAQAVSYAASERALVLVTSAASDLDQLSPPEVRRLYLGAPVSRNGQSLEPLRNLSDEALQEVFLQRVVYLSERAYERQIISRVFRLGGKRPVAFDDSAQLVDALRASPGTVSYMWADEVPADAGLTVLVELWRGTVE
jgi:hypothetical protein